MKKSRKIEKFEYTEAYIELKEIKHFARVERRYLEEGLVV